MLNLVLVKDLLESVGMLMNCNYAKKVQFAPYFEALSKFTKVENEMLSQVDESFREYLAYEMFTLKVNSVGFSSNVIYKPVYELRQVLNKVSSSKRYTKNMENELREAITNLKEVLTMIVNKVEASEANDEVVTYEESVVIDSTDIDGVDCKESITRKHFVKNGVDEVVEISNGYIIEGVSLSDEEYEKQWNDWYENYQSSLKKVVNKAPKNVCRIRKSDSLSRFDSMKKAVKFFRDARGAQLTINNYYKPNYFNHIILIRNTQDNLRKAKEIHKRLSLNNELDTYLSD
jgi:hypothetical protein